MRRYVACYGQNCTKLIIVGAALERTMWTAWSYWWKQTRWLVIEPLQAWRKRWYLRSFLKAGRVGTDDRWPGNLFQMLDATEEHDFENIIEVFFLEGTEMVVEAENRSNREGVYLGKISERYCNTLIAVVAILNSIRWRTGSQCMLVNQNRSDVTVTTLLSNDTGKGILNKLKPEQILYRCASKKGVAVVKAWTHYCGGNCFCVNVIQKMDSIINIHTNAPKSVGV